MKKHLAVVSLAIALAASATTMLRMSLDDLTAQSDAVVHGTVRDVSSRWSSDGMRIVTSIDVDVSETLKGVPSTLVRIVQPGGSVGDIAQSVSGLASFSRGEEVFLFLERRGQSAFAVTGLAQGKFHVDHSSDGRMAIAVPDGLGDAVLVDPITRQPAAPALKPIELDSLRRRVRELATRPRVTP